MAKYTTNFAANASLTEIASVHVPRGKEEWAATVAIQGTFGGGTVTLFQSLDRGTTKIQVRDLAGTLYSTTSNDTFAWVIPGGNSDSQNSEIKLYATLAGATSPNLNVIIIDNN